MIDSIQIKDNIVTSQAAIKVNGSAIDLAFNPNTNLLYVATQSPNSILVIDGSKNIVVQNVTLDVSPDQIELNPNTNMLYVISRGDNRVYVIDARLLIR